MTDTNNTPELDLTDEDTVARLLEADVMRRPAVDEETQDIQTKIKQLQQKTTFTYKVNGIQLEDLKRRAAVKGISWQEFLTEQINTLVFEAPVAKPIINRPSFVEGGRVSAPTGSVSRG